MSFEFARTEDYELIKRILTEPRIYDALHDDYAGPSDQWEPIVHPSVSYCTLKEGDVIIGIAVVNAHSLIQWEIHNAILPHVGWKKRVALAKAFFEWLFQSGCRRIIGRALATNRYAMAFNNFIGMDQIGTNRKAFMKNGQLQDEVWFGLSRPEGKA